MSKAGDLLGTTAAGGTGIGCYLGSCGTIFEVGLDGTENILHSFQGGSDGAFPVGGLTTDISGNYFGTTSQGGNGIGCPFTSEGCGTIFELASDGSEAVLYAFKGGTDGLDPTGDLVIDKNGNLFGTTAEGGNLNITECNNFGCGVVFELKPDGTESVLYTFQAGSDGWEPLGSVIVDSTGNLYGTTELGGDGGQNCTNGSLGCGTVFKLAPDGSETIVHNFMGGSDGEFPVAGLLMDAAGNLYGTTWSGGGAPQCSAGTGCGTVFRITPDGSESVLYAFKGGSDGYLPEGNLTMDKSGNVYGTTYYGGGGGTDCPKTGSVGCGTVFKLAADGTETVLYAFHRFRGKYPAAGLLKGPNGILYGTTSAGGTNNDGVVFSVKK